MICLLLCLSAGAAAEEVPVERLVQRLESGTWAEMAAAAEELEERGASARAAIPALLRALEQGPIETESMLAPYRLRDPNPNTYWDLARERRHAALALIRAIGAVSADAPASPVNVDLMCGFLSREGGLAQLPAHLDPVHVAPAVLLSRLDPEQPFVTMAVLEAIERVGSAAVPHVLRTLHNGPCRRSVSGLPGAIDQLLIRLLSRIESNTQEVFLYLYGERAYHTLLEGMEAAQTLATLQARLARAADMSLLDESQMEALKQYETLIHGSMDFHPQALPAGYQIPIEELLRDRRGESHPLLRMRADRVLTQYRELVDTEEIAHRAVEDNRDAESALLLLAALEPDRAAELATDKIANIERPPLSALLALIEAHADPDLIVDAATAVYSPNLSVVEDALIEAGTQIIPSVIRSAPPLEEREARFFFASVLARFGRDALPALTSAVKTGSQETRLLALRTLQMMGPAAAPAADMLAAALEMGREEATIAASTLFYHPSVAEGAIPALAEIAGDKGHPGSEAAVRTLGAVGPAALDQLLNLVHNGPHLNDVILGIGSIGTGAEEAVSELRHILINRETSSGRVVNNQTRSRSASALIAIGVRDKWLVDGVRSLLIEREGFNGAFRPMAQMRTLGTAASHAYPDLTRLLDEVRPEQRAVVVRTIAAVAPQRPHTAELIIAELRRGRGETYQHLAAAVASAREVVATKLEAEIDGYGWERHRDRGDYGTILSLYEITDPNPEEFATLLVSALSPPESRYESDGTVVNALLRIGDEAVPVLRPVIEGQLSDLESGLRPERAVLDQLSAPLRALAYLTPDDPLVHEAVMTAFRRSSSTYGFTSFFGLLGSTVAPAVAAELRQVASTDAAAQRYTDMPPQLRGGPLYPYRRVIEIMGPPGAYTLHALLESEEPMVRYAGLVYLGSAYPGSNGSGQPPLERAIKLLTDRDPRLQRVAQRKAFEFATPAAIYRALASSDQEVRRNMPTLLTAIGEQLSR